MEIYVLRKLYVPYTINFIKKWNGVKNFGRSWEELSKYAQEKKASYSSEIEEIKNLIPENSVLHNEILEILSKKLKRAAQKNLEINYTHLLEYIFGFILELEQHWSDKQFITTLDVEPELEKMKIDILQGTFLTNNYLVQFPPVATASPLKRWSLYRLDKADEFKGVDCDVSLGAVVTYALMHDWIGEITIQKQEKSDRKYELKNSSGRTYKGDTLTSAWSFFKQYLNCLYKDQEISEKFKTLFDQSKNGSIAIDSDEYERLEKFFHEEVISNNTFLAIVENTISNEAKVFLDNCYKAGNLIVCPENFNVERSGTQYNSDLDTIDRMLWAIFNYFKAKEEKEKEYYLKKLFIKVTTDGFKLSKASFENWLKDTNVNSWNDFIEVHLLEPFVDSEKMPISMKTGKPIEESESKDYTPMPKTLNQFETFFSNLNERINKRNELIYKKCRENY